VRGITYAFSSQEYHNIACQISLEGFIPAEDIKHCVKWVTFIGTQDTRPYWSCNIALWTAISSL